MARRYLCCAVGTLAAGIVIFDASVNRFWIVFGLLFLAGLFLLIKSRRIYCIILALMLLIGGVYGDYTQNAYKSSPIYQYTDNPCSGKMFVTGVKTKDEKFVTVYATVTEVEGIKVSEPVLFTIYNLSDIKVNTVIEFNELKFSIPEGARNRGGFDYNRYLKSKGIYFTAFSDRAKLTAKGEDGFFLLRYCRTFKQQVDYKCAEIFGGSYAAQMMPAILVGNDISLSNEIEDLFSAAGITHILVASGMHVSVVLLICSILLYPLNKRRRLYNILSGFVVVAFAMVVGFHPSIMRAVISYFIYLFARYALRSADPVTVLFESMGIILLINPLSIYNLSFQLSFSALFGILTLTPHIIRRFKWLVQLPRIAFKLPSKLGRCVMRVYNIALSAAAMSVAAQLGVLPVMVSAFNGTAIMAVPVNIMVTFLTPVVYGAGIIATVTGLEPFVTVTKLICDFFVWGAECTAAIPGNNMSLPSSDLITVACLLFSLFCLLRCKSKKFARYFEISTAICYIMVLVGCVQSSYIPKDKIEVNFLNVEQGDCAVIRLHDYKTVVLDTGTENMCAFEVVSYLQRLGTDKIDALILSHNDNDHAGGAQLLDTKIGVEKVITSKQHQIDFDGAEHITLSSGDEFNIGNARFTVLNPEENSGETSDNESSLVLRLDFGESSFLFTGDVTAAIERRLENVDADVLKVSHHGSKSASSESFLKRVTPMYSVISVGKDNSYGHPDENVIERLQENSVRILRTDEDYTITFVADLKGGFSLTKGL